MSLKQKKNEAKSLMPPTAVKIPKIVKFILDSHLSGEH